MRRSFFDASAPQGGLLSTLLAAIAEFKGDIPQGGVS
jgi:hypothetical protein